MRTTPKRKTTSNINTPHPIKQIFTILEDNLRNENYLRINITSGFKKTSKIMNKTTPEIKTIQKLKTISQFKKKKSISFLPFPY